MRKYAPSQRRFLAPLDELISAEELADFQAVIKAGWSYRRSPPSTLLSKN